MSSLWRMSRHLSVDMVHISVICLFLSMKLPLALIREELSVFMYQLKKFVRETKKVDVR